MQQSLDKRQSQQGMAGESRFLSVKQRAADSLLCSEILLNIGKIEQRIAFHRQNIRALKDQHARQERQIADLEMELRKVPLPTPGGMGKRIRDIASEMVGLFVSVVDSKQQRKRIQRQIGILKTA